LEKERGEKKKKKKKKQTITLPERENRFKKFCFRTDLQIQFLKTVNGQRE